MQPWQRLLALRDRNEAPIDSEANLADVIALENSTKLALPPDFRDYLIHGVGSDAWTDPFVSTWWAVSAVRPIRDEYDHPIINDEVAATAHQWLVFADFAIWSQAWAIDCGPGGGQIMVINGTTDHVVARSFADFVDTYLMDIFALL
ncbi:MAG: hypothetical protein JWR84_121 [Caulobacter sp.]|nr:hypothetical protein [Caulobacter sp.]